MKVLIVEDEDRIRELLKGYCDGKGHEAATASDGLAGLKRFRAFAPDLVLLDIMLPLLDGWGVLEEIRKSSDVPVIFLTSLAGTDDIVRGLALGADDYLRKPFEMKELDARIEAVRRRAGQAPEGAIFLAGPLRIDDRSKQVTVGDREIELTVKEFELLRLLATDVGRVFSQDEILARLWRGSPRAGAADVKQYVHLLRRKLGDDGRDLIRTVKRFGYQLVT
jgi:OmpR family response regulator RpaB